MNNAISCVESLRAIIQIAQDNRQVTKLAQAMNVSRFSLYLWKGNDTTASTIHESLARTRLFEIAQLPIEQYQSLQALIQQAKKVVLQMNKSIVK